MKTQLIKTAAVILVSSLAFTACKKSDNNPAPDEQELITTIKMTLTNGSSVQTYTYKIENGFNSTTPGTVQADTLKLTPNTTYTSVIQVLNEKKTPVENTTDEILSERDEHLFLYLSDPATGAGSVSFSNGNKDNNGKPFNLTGSITSGAAGSGKLKLYLIHQPTDKTATTLAGAGGETDVASEFPVTIQ